MDKDGKTPLGVKLTFEQSSDECPASKRAVGNYGLVVSAYCDSKLSSGQYDKLKWDKVSKRTCVQEVSFYSKNACPAFDTNYIF